MYTLRILLVQCDVVRLSESVRSHQADHQGAIKELTKVALVNRMAMLVAWSYVHGALWR